ncbi:hypothetical protein GCM10022233_37090 [Streptomyces shaanxiensis]|uniref:Uncharacterized protein n=1 Tax=Streptomyces shaanxiensis TaxID=653357 RepID=A0ABP7V6N4_9ACTN
MLPGRIRPAEDTVGDAVRGDCGVLVADGRGDWVLAVAVGLELLLAVGVSDAVGVLVSDGVVALTWVVATVDAAVGPASSLRSGSKPMTR